MNKKCTDQLRTLKIMLQETTDIVDELLPMEDSIILLQSNILETITYWAENNYNWVKLCLASVRLEEQMRKSKMFFDET
jgi:hypothetical protein